MKQMAIEYKKLVLDNGFPIQEDPFEQLRDIITKVLDSWQSPKAKTYRQIIEISDDWGPRWPFRPWCSAIFLKTPVPALYLPITPMVGRYTKALGDFALGNQGEDCRRGLVETLPISIIQQEIEKRDTDIILETHFPEIYETLKTWANDLIYRRGWSPQEIEFTFESPKSKDLYLLQARDMAMRERKKVLTFDLGEDVKNKRLGHGIGISGVR